MPAYEKTFGRAFSDDLVQPLKYTSEYIEPYHDRNHEMDTMFPGIKVKAPYVRTIKEHEPQDLNFDD